MKHIRHLTIALIVAAACSNGEQAQVSEKAANSELAAPEVVIRTKDYVFDAPDTISAGVNKIRLINDGPDLHHVWLVRLEEGKTIKDLSDAMASGHGALPSWAVDVGGPNTPNGGPPGQENSAVLNLEAGNYVMLCVIPAPADGQPHVMKGMIKSLTVVPSATPPAPAPTANIVMTLDDFTFSTDKPITAGQHTFRVENSAAQTHEVLFVKLEAGKTPQDVINFVMKPQGTPPGAIVGGITGIARGEVNYTTLDFTPGEYALICFVPDAKDGKPHFLHGMTKQFTVS